MFDGQREIVTVSAEVEIAIARGAELGRTTQRLSGACVACAHARVTDGEHGRAMPALQLAQIGEQRRDLAAGVLIDALQAHERIEDEDAWLQSCDGLGEAVAVGYQSRRTVGAVMTWMSTPVPAVAQLTLPPWR